MLLLLAEFADENPPADCDVHACKRQKYNEVVFALVVYCGEAACQVRDLVPLTLETEGL